MTVEEEPSAYPATDACQYLARRGIEPELHEWVQGDRPGSAALIDAAAMLKAGYIAMGAYGHWRLREIVLGGTTREMLRSSPLPLILAH